MIKHLKNAIFVIVSIIGLLFLCNTKTIVNAQDSTELTIKLLGDETIYLVRNSRYVELGAQAYDPVDGDISNNIVINSSSINNSVAGTYTVSYSITNSQLETKTISRNVVVEDYIKSFQYAPYTSTSNTWNDFIETSDGGFVSVGGYYQSYNPHYYSSIKKYDSNMNLLWTTEYTRYNSYCYGLDCLEDNGRILFLTNQNLYMYGLSGNTISSLSVSGKSYIEKVANNQYLLLASNSREGLFVNFNGSSFTYSSFTLEYAFSSSKNNSFYYDGKLFYLNNNKIVQFDYETKSTTVIDTLELDSIIKDENNIYGIKNNDYIIKYDLNFKQEKKVTTKIVNTNVHMNTNYIIGETSNRKIVYYDKELNIVEEQYIDSMNFSSIMGVFVSTTNDTYIYGRSNYYCQISKLSSLAILGIEDETYELNSDINYSEMIKILNKDCYYYVENIDSSEVDTSKAGIYNVYFIVKLMDEDGIKTIQASKEITILHESSLEIGGGAYEGSILIDIEGAAVFINETEYFYGDVYSTPGYSSINIIGNNGYERTIEFFITPIVDGIIEGGTYYQPVIPNISGGELSLDGEAYTNGTEIYTKGNHTLTITGASAPYYVTNDPSLPFVLTNGVYTSTNKTVGSSTLTLTFSQNGEFSFDYWVSSELNYDFLTISKNGSQLVRISGITDAKTYSLNVVAGDYLTFTYSHDSGGYVGDDAAYIKVKPYYKTVNFTIEPTITGVADGKTYNTTIRPQINAENMTLNNQVYNNEEITNCGNYELVIIGTGGYTKTLNFVIETVVEGLEDEGVYDASVTPTFTKGTATLNGETYISGTAVTLPGYNTLIITGEDGYSVEYNFTINGTIEGIENLSAYTGSVTPVISGGKLFLNDSEYTSGTVIDVPGNYILEINGAAGYYKKIVFVVKPEKINVVNGQTYNHSLIPAISQGTLTLNGEAYISGTILNRSGSYKLQIIGENGYLEIVNFTLKTGANVEEGAIYIDETTLHFIGEATLNGSTVEAGSVINEVGNYILQLVDGDNTYTYNFSIEPDYSLFESEIIEEFKFEYLNANVKLNSEDYISGTTISEVGKYVLVVEGVNEYSKTYQFNIDPYCNIISGEEFTDSVEIHVVGGTIELDGAPYTEKMTVSEIGNHTITVSGINEYAKTINFVINPSIAGVEDFGYYFEGITPIINSTNIKLNSENYQSGTSINENGIYSLVITGANQYQKIINFIILPSDFSVKPNEYYSDIVKISSCDASVEIDGMDYTFNQEITAYGIHTITLKYNEGFSNYSFYILPLIEGIQQGSTYEESVVINTNYPYLLLNNNPYTSGEEIIQIGNHTLVLKDLNGYDHLIEFTVKEKISSVVDGGEYEDSVFITLPNGTATLDGASYTFGTEIKSVGVHTLTVYGINGYENPTVFTILENTNNLEDGGEYEGSVKITIPNATLKLDGNDFSSNTTVSSVGYHVLTVIGTGGYEKVYNFLITPIIRFSVDGSSVTFEEGKSYENATYITVAVSNVQSILLNDTNSSFPCNIYNIGNHNIKIYGTNDYMFEMNFTKEAIISGVQDGGEYASYTTVTCNYTQKIELNGDVFSNGSRIFTIGNHNLTVYGEGDYTKEISFVVKPYFYTSGSTYMSSSGGEKVCTSGARFRLYNSYNDITLNTSYYSKMEIDGKTYANDSYYYYVGNHKLIIYGINDYTFEVDFILTPSVTNLIEGKESAAFTPTIYLSNSYTYSDEERYILLDGEAYQPSTLITEVGNHTLTIYGSNEYTKEYNFVVLPTVSGLSNDASYYGSITPTINNCELLLDEKEYTSGTTITEVGNHIITVIGSNDYIKKYSFTITPLNISKYEDETFVRELIINDITDCQIYINEEKYSLGDKILTIGNNKVVIYGLAEYSYEFQFTITEEPKLQTEEGNLPFVNKFSANRMVKINIPYADLLIDGEEYTSNTEYLIVGKHYLVINGLNGYTTEYEFTINDKVYGVADGGTYENLTIICDNATKLTLNSIEIENGYVVNNVGSYVLVVEGTNGYVNSYSFIIDSKISGIVDGGQYEDIIAPVFNSNNVTLNGKEYISGTAITEVGNHTIVVNGANGYQETITFVIKETITGVEDAQTYTDIRNIEISGKCQSITLNGEEIANNTVANEVGNNNLVITGINGYEKRIKFIIDSVVTGVEDSKTYNEEIVISASGVGCVIELNDQEVSNVTKVNTIGDYTYTVKGINGYIKSIRFSLSPIITGLENDGIYSGEAKVNINMYPQSVKLNGEDVSLEDIVNNTLIIQTIGNNKLSIETTKGTLTELQFMIKPIVTNITDEGIYTGSVTPNIKGIPLDYQLNGKSIDVNSSIDVVGYNTLTIAGLDGYEEVINFTVEVELLNLPDKEVLQFDPNFNGNGKVYLNNEKIADDTSNIPTITTIGHNVIEVKGEGNYSKTYEVTIIPIISGVANEDVKTSYDIVIENEGRIYIDGDFVTKQLENYNEIGYHTLLIEGKNDYTYSIVFTVVEDYEITDTYSNYFQLSYTSGRIQIDGTYYISNSRYSVAGHHELTVFGTNGYSSKYNICIIPVVEGINTTNIYNGSATFSVLPGNTIIIDDEEYSNWCNIYSIGNHTLKIIGRRDYEYSYEFVILESTNLEEKEYTNSVTISFYNEFESIILDGNSISNNYVCNTIGSHKLTVYGANDYSKTYEFTIEPSITGIRNDIKYETSVSWTIGGKAKIEVDGIEHSLKEEYSMVGNHTMRIYSDFGYERIINFTILPNISGVVDGGTYNNSVIISTSNCSLKLNGEDVDNNITVTPAGYYELVIEGSNGYSQVINFTILPNISGVVNGETYQSTVTISASNCSLKLNGEDINNSIRVSKVGYYELVIEGSNGYSQVINFTIAERVLSFTNGESYEKLNIAGLSNCKLLLNGNIISNNTLVSDPGKHILTIIGENGYSKEYTFIIKFSMTSINNEIKTNGGQIFVNGKQVNQGYVIETIGYNTIKLVGLNGYTLEEKIFIKEKMEISDGKSYQNRVLVEKTDAQVFIDGVEIFEDTYLDKAGTHTIKILGAGGYQATFNVKVINTHIVYTIIASSIIAICLIGFAILVIKRKKVI